MMIFLFVFQLNLNTKKKNNFKIESLFDRIFSKNILIYLSLMKLIIYYLNVILKSNCHRYFITRHLVK